MAVLTLVAASSVILHAWILREEKIKLLDEQVRETASTILDSQIVGLRTVDYATVEKILTEELGKSRIGKFFVIRSRSGEIVYQSSSATLMGLENVPQNPQWVTLSVKGKYVRALNLKLPTISDRSVQVGVIVDAVLLDFVGLTRRSSGIFLLMSLFGLLLAWVLTSTLLAPLVELEHYVSTIALQVTRMKTLSKMPKKLRDSLDREGVASKDEYFRLLKGIEVLIEKMNRSYRSSRVWSYQMAHEIKTPLSILKLEIERAVLTNLLEENASNSMNKELDRTTGIVSAFLEWAEMETTDQRAPLHAIPMSEQAIEVVKLLEKKYPDRLELGVEKDFVVLANPQHLEQTLTNLVSNALKYSPAGSKVKILLKSRKLVVEDKGRGIPDSVIEQIGEPFNRSDRGDEVRGHGLGLAWVASVVGVYSWKLSFEKSAAGTRAIIDFGPEGFQASSDGSFPNAVL
ncbi:MAG: HAMP domain-containing sensor histidine kinase [Bdellovibrionota bacterium]